MWQMLKQETNSNYPAHILHGNPLKINSEKCRTQSVMTQSFQSLDLFYSLILDSNVSKVFFTQRLVLQLTCALHSEPKQDFFAFQVHLFVWNGKVDSELVSLQSIHSYCLHMYYAEFADFQNLRKQKCMKDSHLRQIIRPYITLTVYFWSHKPFQNKAINFFISFLQVISRLKEDI